MLTGKHLFTKRVWTKDTTANARQRGLQSRIQAQRPEKQRLLRERPRGWKLYWIKETLRVRKEAEEEAEHTPSLCPNYCVTVGLSPISLLPSTLIYPAATILYRPIWIKGGMGLKREGDQSAEQRERKHGGKREMWWTLGQWARSWLPLWPSPLSHCSGW